MRPIVADRRTFVTPSGTTPNGNYISFLRRVAPMARLRLKGLLDPVVVVLDGKTISVLMPVKVQRQSAVPPN